MASCLKWSGSASAFLGMPSGGKMGLGPSLIRRCLVRVRISWLFTRRPSSLDPQAFTTYKPLLHKIKLEYDAALDEALKSSHENIIMRAELAVAEQRRARAVEEARAETAANAAVLRAELHSRLLEAEERSRKAEAKSERRAVNWVWVAASWVWVAASIGPSPSPWSLAARGGRGGARHLPRRTAGAQHSCTPGRFEKENEGQRAEIEGMKAELAALKVRGKRQRRVAGGVWGVWRLTSRARTAHLSGAKQGAQGRHGGRVHVARQADGGPDCQPQAWGQALPEGGGKRGDVKRRMRRSRPIWSPLGDWIGSLGTHDVTLVKSSIKPGHVGVTEGSGGFEEKHRPRGVPDKPVRSTLLALY